MPAQNRSVIPALAAGISPRTTPNPVPCPQPPFLRKRTPTPAQKGSVIPAQRDPSYPRLPRVSRRAQHPAPSIAPNRHSCTKQIRHTAQNKSVMPAQNRSVIPALAAGISPCPAPNPVPRPQPPFLRRQETRQAAKAALPAVLFPLGLPLAVYGLQHLFENGPIDIPGIRCNVNTIEGFAFDVCAIVRAVIAEIIQQSD